MENWVLVSGVESLGMTSTFRYFVYNRKGY